MRIQIIITLFLLASIGLYSQEKDASTKKYDLVSGYEIKEMKLNDIVFLYTQNTLQDTVRIWTTDLNFKTPEDYRVSTRLKELPKKMQSQVDKRHDGYRLELNSCWYLYFCEGETCVDKPLAADSEVKWIQKNR